MMVLIGTHKVAFDRRYLAALITDSGDQSYI